MNDLAPTISLEQWYSAGLTQWFSWSWFVYRDRLSLALIVAMLATQLLSEFVTKQPLEVYKEV